MQSTVIAGLEGEKASLERERDALRSSMDGLRTAQRKVRRPSGRPRPPNAGLSRCSAGMLTIKAFKPGTKSQPVYQRSINRWWIVLHGQRVCIQ